MQFTSIVDSYFKFMETKSDPRTNDWFLIKSPGPLITILATYVYFCKFAGPRYMRDRKPYDLKNTIIVYNLVQVLLSLYLVYEGSNSGWFQHYKLSCQPVEYTNDPISLRMANSTYIYFICKLIELLDTVFFVLRKKFNQVSFLHVYHHTLMPVAAWICVHFIAGGHGTLLGLINCFIHVIMYAYYLISSLGPQYQKYLWWKKHVTALQLVQFGLIFVHNFQVLFRSCEYPKMINLLLATQAAFFIYLFGSFYRRMYIKSCQEKLRVENLKRQQIIVVDGGSKEKAL